MIYNQSGFKVERGKVILSHFYNSIFLEFQIPEKFEFEKVYQVVILKNSDDFYISITYEKAEKLYSDNRLYQAIDLGITKTVTAVNMHGKFLEVKSPRPDKYWQPKIEEVQSKRDHCKKGSNRWERLRQKLRKMQGKCSNQTKDFQHKLSRKLVENTKANTIIIGDLNVKEMAQTNNLSSKMKNGLNRATQNNGYLSRFAGFLTYKAKLAGKRVIEISEEGTTKTCCVCGKKYDMKIWDRTMSCDCGNELDRDKNSAINIMVRFLSQNASVDRLLSFKESILRQTGLATASYSQEALTLQGRVVH
jgi:putative transposase